MKEKNRSSQEQAGQNEEIFDFNNLPRKDADFTEKQKLAIRTNMERWDDTYFCNQQTSQTDGYFYSNKRGWIQSMGLSMNERGEIRGSMVERLEKGPLLTDYMLRYPNFFSGKDLVVGYRIESDRGPFKADIASDFFIFLIQDEPEGK